MLHDVNGNGWVNAYHHCSAVTRELPNNTPYTAKRSLIQDFQRSWETHAMACFERVQTNVKTHLTELIKNRFERFSHLKGVIRWVWQT